MPTEQEYTDAAEERIKRFARNAGEEIGPFTLTAIHSELKTMLQVGKGSRLIQGDVTAPQRPLKATFTEGPSKSLTQETLNSLLESPVKLGYNGPLFPDDKTEFNVVSVDVVSPGTPKPEVPGVAYTDPVPLSPQIPDLALLPCFGDLFTLEEFRAMVDGGGVTDDDGSGEWATSTHYHNSGIRFANVFNGMAPDWATHVIWFNK